jgi:hypothetical protein
MLHINLVDNHFITYVHLCLQMDYFLVLWVPIYFYRLSFYYIIHRITKIVELVSNLCDILVNRYLWLLYINVLRISLLNICRNLRPLKLGNPYKSMENNHLHYHIYLLFTRNPNIKVNVSKGLLLHQM